MKKYTILATLAAALCVPMLASAQTPPPAGQPPMPEGHMLKPHELGEGQRVRPVPKDLTRTEALRQAAERFDAQDANKDGVVTGEELRAWFEAMRKNGGPSGGPGGPGGRPNGPPAGPGAPAGPR